MAHYTADCVGEAAQQCMLVKENEGDDWSFYYDQIEGFEYESGFEYQLVIEESEITNPPADASSLKWTLTDLVSKNQSERLVYLPY